MKKTLLMKQGVLGILKTKGQFISLFLLIFICSIITACLFTTVTSLQKSNREMGYGSFDYDYSMHYSAIDFENSNMQTISPTFTFDTHYILVNDGINKVTYPKMTIGAANSDVFFDLKSDDINFSCNDSLRCTEISDFEVNLKFRKTAPAYQNSLLAKMFKQGDLKSEQLAQTYFASFKKTLIYKNFLGIIKDYINKEYINPINLPNVNNIKTEIQNMINGKADAPNGNAINRWDSDLQTANNNFQAFDLPTISVTLSSDNQAVEVLASDLFAGVVSQKPSKVILRGLEGSFGLVSRYSIKRAGETNFDPAKIQYIGQSPYNYIDSLNQTGINESRMVIGDLFNKVTFFGNYSERSSFLNFVQNYYEMLGIVANLDVTMRQEITTWDIVNNLKYKVIGWHDLIKKGQLQIFDHIEEWQGPSTVESSITTGYAVVSPNYLKSQKKVLRDTIAIGQQTFTVGATGGDTLNIYPTIYDSDLVPNLKTDSVIYLSSYAMAQLAADNTKGLISLKDNSRVFLKSNDNNKEQNLKTFLNYYANNPNQLDLYVQNRTAQNLKVAASSIGTIEDKSTTVQLTARYDLLAQTINIYIYIGVFFISIFGITLLIVGYIIVKEMIKRESSQIGMLKANGYYLREIALSYWSILMLSVIIAVPFGWLLGISLQLIVAKLFGLFFIINWTFTWNWLILLLLLAFFVSIISIITFGTCFFSINKTEVLSLINPTRDVNMNTWTSKIVRNFRFRSFVGHFRMVILATSLKQAFTFFGIFLLVTFTLTISLLTPVFVRNFNTNYYKNIDYGSEVKYGSVISNNPLSYYQTYNWNGIKDVPTTPDLQNALYPIGGMTPLANYYSLDGGQNRRAINLVGSESSPAAILKDMLAYNFTTLSGVNLSLGLFNYINELVSQSTGGDSVRALISEILCNVLPNALGVGAISYPPYPDKGDYVEIWNSCFAKATSGLIPASVKEDWIKNPTQANHFALGLGTMSYNPKVDNLFTSFNSNYNGQNLEITGIDKNTNMLKLSSSAREALNDRTEVKAVSNISALRKLNLNVGDIIDVKSESETLQYNIDNNEDNQLWGELTNASAQLGEQSWKYNITGAQDSDLGHFLSLYDLDKSRFTYSTSSNIKFYGSADAQSEYKKLANVELWIPANKTMEDIWSNKVIVLSNGQQRKLLEESTNTGIKPVRKENVNGVSYWAIRPYDFNFDRPYNGDFTNGIPTTWYQAAVDNGFIKARAKLNPQPLKIKIVDVIDTYDTPRLFINHQNANLAMGFQTSSALNNSNILKWYNGKYTKELQPADQISRYALASKNGDLSLNNFARSFSSVIKGADYVGIKSQVMNRVALIALSIASIFIIIIILISVITIYFAIDLFIKKFVKIIAIMKIQGYSRREINNLTLGIFVPFAAVGWALGYFITWAIVWTLAMKILTIFNIFVPIGTGLLTLPVILGGIIILYVVSYFISMRKIDQLNIQEIVMIESE